MYAKSANPNSKNCKPAQHIMPTGPVAIPMTNDYLFRALLQRNNKVLRGLISSLLHLPLEDIHTVTIENPIELGKALDDKDFFLDIKIFLNDNTIINLEMQVINEKDWPERSLSYLCRTFDHLSKGQTYLDTKSVIHIGLLNFTLFPDHPEFYATYKLMNVKNHAIYSDKFTLSVLNLTHTDLATEEDKLYQIDHWASLFKSTTWEELEMLAKNNEYIQEATETIRQLSQDEKIRLQCEAREDYYRRQRGMQIRLEQAEQAEKRAAEIEAWARETETRAKETEARAKETEVRAKETEARAKETEARAKETEARAKETEARAKETEARAKETETRIKTAEAELQKSEAKLQESESRARAAEAKMLESEQENIQLQRTIDERDSQLAQAQAEIARLKAALAVKS